LCASRQPLGGTLRFAFPPTASQDLQIGARVAKNFLNVAKGYKNFFDLRPCTRQSLNNGLSLAQILLQMFTWPAIRKAKIQPFNFLVCQTRKLKMKKPKTKNQKNGGITMNHCTFTGRLIKDAEVTKTTNGKTKHLLLLACDTSFTEKSGERKTTIVKAIVYGDKKLTAHQSRLLLKGTLVALQAEFVSDRYVKEGVTQYYQYFHVLEIDILESEYMIGLRAKKPTKEQAHETPMNEKTVTHEGGNAQ
jgi:single-stranded DNA-binding protein